MNETQWAQTVMTVGIPTVAVLVGILINNSRISDLHSAISGRFGSMDARFASIDARLSALEARMTNLESKFDTHFGMLLEKVHELDVRLTRVEERLEQR